MFKSVIPKLVRAITQSKVSTMPYYPQQKFFVFDVENLFCTDRS